MSDQRNSLGWHSRIEWRLETNGNPHFAAIAGIGAAALGAGSSLAGGKKGASAATQAANIQAQAAQYAANLQQQRFLMAQQQLTPFMNYGTAAIPAMQGLTGVTGGPAGVLSAPLTRLPQQWSPTMQNLANMPGYQFQLRQGELATQAGQAGGGLGLSGAAQKAGQMYASGLAGANWQQNWAQFLGQQQLAQAGRQQTYNMLSGQIGTGLSAAGALAGVGIQSGSQIGQTLQQGAAAQASGLMGAANYQIGAMQGAAQAPLQGALLSNMLTQQATPYFSGGINMPALASINQAAGLAY